MKLQERIASMAQLGAYLQSGDEYLKAVMHRTYRDNQWFTIENQEKAITAIATEYLDQHKLERWTQQYDIPVVNTPKTIGLVMAGNIPLVGFHDLLSVFIAGHRSLIKLSEKDKFLLPALLKQLEKIDSRTTEYFKLVPTLKGFEAVIATGSNNASRYFEAYFGKYPNIIRKNRNGIAVLTGKESETDLLQLGTDVFQYFGLGCRNISKLYVPQGYAFEPLLEALHEYRQIVNHKKYKNNFDYHYSVYIINRVSYLANGCILLRENEAIPSPIANLHYEYYENQDTLEAKLLTQSEQIQLVVSQLPFSDVSVTGFGAAQQPALADYADGVDTMDFLVGLRV